MAFSIGDLIARLRFDTRDFENGVQRADRGLKTVEQAAARTDRAVGGASRATRAYADAQRLSSAEIAQATRAYDRMFGSMEAAHAEALRMNATLDAQVGSARRGVGGLSRLNFTLASLARQATGTHPALGQLANVVATFAVGSLATAGVLAGIAAIALAIRGVGREAREARERLEEAIGSLENLAEQRGIEALGGPVAAQRATVFRELVEQAQRWNAAMAALARAERDLEAARGAPAREGVDLEASALQRVVSAQNALNAAKEESLRLAELLRIADEALREAEARRIESITREIEDLTRKAEQAQVAINAMMRDIVSFGGFTVRDRGPGRLLEGQTGFSSFGVGDPTRGAFGRRLGFTGQNREAQQELSRETRNTARNMRALNVPLDDTPGLLDQFGEGIKRALGSVDPGVLGANLAAGGIGFVIGALGDALFGDRYVSALERNTRALESLSGDNRRLQEIIDRGIGEFIGLPDRARDILAQSNIDAALDIARRRAAAGDLTPGEEFTLFQKALTGADISTELAKQVAQLTPDTVDEFLLQILEQIAAGTFDPALLGRLDVDTFLDALANMESLADAAGLASDELSGLADVVRNAPAGFRVNFARFTAETPTQIGGDDNSVTVQGDVVVVTDNPDELGRRIRREARRGGTTALQLATRPSARPGARTTV